MITCIHLIRKLQDSTGSLQSNQLAAMNCTLVLGKDAQNGDWKVVYDFQPFISLFLNPSNFR